MGQQFNDEVAQVAGRDIINYTTHIHAYAAPNTHADARNQLIRLLLRKSELAGMRRMLENVSQTLYGSRYFKSLTLEQLITLHEISDEVLEVLYRSRGQCSAQSTC